jgi:membrane protease YdiL (CAAX protease family)
MPDDRTVPILATLMGVLAVVAAGGSWAYRRRAGRSLWAEEPRPVVPWGPASVGGVALLYLTLLSMASSLPDRMLGGAMAGLGVAALTPLLLWATSGAQLGDLGLSRRDLGRNVVRGLAACALALPLVYLVQYGAVKIWKPRSHPVEQVVLAARSVRSVLVAACGAVVAAPLAEEILFRGVLLGALWKVGSRDPQPSPGVVLLAKPSAWSPPTDLAANAVVSLIFAGLHADQWPAPIPLFVLSMGFGEVYRRSGSLVAAIAMHACFNGLSMAVLLVATATKVGP